MFFSENIYTVHLISQPPLNYINLSSVLTIGPWQPCGRVLSLFVTSQCYVGHNDSGICKIISPVFCFLLTQNWNIVESGVKHHNTINLPIWELKFNTPYNIKEIKMSRCNVYRQKYRSIVVNELFYRHKVPINCSQWVVSHSF